MWTRVMLKDQAKQILRYTYWQTFVVCLLMGFITGTAQVPSLKFNFFDSSNGYNGYQYNVEYFFNNYISSGIIIIAFFIFLFILVIGIALSTLIFSPLDVGCRKYLIASAQGDNSLNYVGFSFTSGYYKNIITVMFFKNLFIFLWSLLCGIPGIIKTYEYYFVSYILAENPGMPWREALNLSSRMTYGKKWDIFVLNLSFIPWYLLGALACGLGILFVNPYVMATDAQLFLASKYDAKAKGLYTGI